MISYLLKAAAKVLLYKQFNRIKLCVYAVYFMTMLNIQAKASI